MIWTCPVCNEELGELNGYCEYCRVYRNITVYNPDKYFIREIRIDYITHRASGASEMTPQEELFSKLFNHEKLLVKDMDILTLRAHREELAQIAFEARARLTAVDDEDSSRKKVKKGDKPTGFERSLNVDETTTNAINTLKIKKEKLSKAEKIREGLLKLGIDPDAADKIMSAKNLLTQVQKVQNHTKPIVSEEKKIPVFNPFEKKE